MKKPMSCGTVSCLTISMASLMRLGCHASMGVMSWAACQSIWWSLMYECLTMADFSKSPLRPCARCSFNLAFGVWNRLRCADLVGIVTVAFEGSSDVL